MKLKTEHFQKLAHKITQALKEKKLIVCLSSEDQIKKKMISVFQKDAGKLDQIHRQATDMMSQYKNKVESGEIDYQKMFGMIKTQLYKANKIDPSQVNYSENHMKKLALQIHDALYHDEDVNYTDEEKSLTEMQNHLLQYVAIRDKLTQIVQTKITSLKRTIAVGSNEWHVLFDKYMEEELRKHGM